MIKTVPEFGPRICITRKHILMLLKFHICAIYVVWIEHPTLVTLWAINNDH